VVLSALQKNLYHVLILYISMREGDTTDSQGLVLLKDLAERGLTEALQVIILSAYGTNQRVRQAFKEYKVADFLEKTDFFADQTRLLDSVHAATTLAGQINLSLEISWPPQMNRARTAQQLLLDTPAFRKHRYSYDKMGAELEDLFCRLFYNAQGVRVQNLTPGWSGAGVVKIQPFYHHGGKGHDLLVKFGSHESIAQEYRNFLDHVHNFISDGRNAIALQKRRTVHLGGIIYTYLGAGGDVLVDFATFYRQHTRSEIEKALDQLITRTCENWYANRTELRHIKVASFYQQMFAFPPNRLEQTLGKYLQPLKVERKQHLTFFALPGRRNFTNPLAVVDPQITYFSYISKTHGDLNAHNMLVDDRQRIWLIDFQSTGQSHILRDIATLDALIRFQLLPEDEATLSDRCFLEETLCRIDSYEQLASMPDLFPTNNEALHKAFSLIVFLRRLAGQVISLNRQTEINEYYTALFYIALNTLRFTQSLGHVQREHALLSASLLADELKFGSSR
jgi:thiamine kinase-like enzyme